MTWHSECHTFRRAHAPPWRGPAKTTVIADANSIVTLENMKPLAFLFAALVVSPLHAANWPAWRGPTGDGVTTETALPLTWSATENVKWKVALPAPGNSTPIVWGARVFVTQADGKRRTLM